VGGSAKDGLNQLVCGLMMSSVNHDMKPISARASLILTLFSVVLPAWGGVISFLPGCTTGVPPSSQADSCVGLSGPGAPDSPFALNFTTSVAGPVITDAIQGTITFAIGPSNSTINIFTIQTVIPDAGVFWSFNQAANIYLWTDQPLAGPLVADVSGCALLHGSGSGDCFAPALSLAVPYLGANPNLADTAHLTLGNGDSGFGSPVVGSGNWENQFFIHLSGGTGANHVRVVIDGSAVFTNGTLVPEPLPAVQLGIGLALLFAVAYESNSRGTRRPQLLDATRH